MHPTDPIKVGPRIRQRLHSVPIVASALPFTNTVYNNPEPAMPRFEVRYADVMRPLEMGYAIWQADPFDEYEKITLGCAGEINKGKLTPRWQMWHDASYLEGQIHRQRIEARKPLHTTNVKEVDVDISLSSDTLPAPASAGLGIGYQCTDSRAGLLSLKDGYAISEDLRKRREKELTKYLISHHEEIMSACEIEDLEELAVVTGTTMTGDWDAVYLESNSREGRVSVEAGLSQVLLQRTNVVVKHSRNQNPFLSSGHHHNPPRDPGCSCCEEIKNQCIFVRTLRLRRRPLRKTPKVIKAGAEPNDYDRDSDTGYDADGILSDSTNSIGSSSDEEHLLVVKDEDDDIIQAPDLVDQAFDYIFSNCNAELAILHDRDIEKMREALNGNSSPMLPIAINDEFSVASLFHEDNPVINSGWDIVHSTTPKTHPDDESGEPPRALSSSPMQSAPWAPLARLPSVHSNSSSGESIPERHTTPWAELHSLEAYPPPAPSPPQPPSHHRSGTYISDPPLPLIQPHSHLRRKRHRLNLHPPSAPYMTHNRSPRMHSKHLRSRHSYPIFKEPRVEEGSDQLRPPEAPMLQAPGVPNDPGNPYSFGTRKTMLAELDSWIPDEGSSKIWVLNGPGGKGKSSIAPAMILETRWPLTRTKRPLPNREVENNKKRRKSNNDVHVHDDEDSPDDDGGCGRARLRGACANCKSLKVRCDFSPETEGCRKCRSSGKECIVPGRKPHKPPAKREEPIKQIRDKDATISQQLEQLESHSPDSLLLAPSSTTATNPIAPSQSQPPSAAAQAALQHSSEKREKDISKARRRIRQQSLVTTNKSGADDSSVSEMASWGSVASSFIDGELGSTFGRWMRSVDESARMKFGLARVTASRIKADGRNGHGADEASDQDVGSWSGFECDVWDTLLEDPAYFKEGGIFDGGSTYSRQRSQSLPSPRLAPDRALLLSTAPLRFMANEMRGLQRRSSNGRGKMHKVTGEAAAEDSDSDSAASTEGNHKREILSEGNPKFFKNSDWPMDPLRTDLAKMLQEEEDWCTTYSLNLSTYHYAPPPETTVLRSHFPSEVISAISSRYHPQRSNLYPIQMHQARLHQASALRGGRKTLETWTRNAVSSHQETGGPPGPPPDKAKNLRYLRGQAAAAVVPIRPIEREKAIRTSNVFSERSMRSDRDYATGSRA